MLTRRDLLCCGGVAALFAPWMKGLSARAQASADRLSGQR